MTTWKPIPGWHGYYEASDTGLIRSIERTVRNSRGVRTIKPRILRPSANGKDYRIVVLSREGKRHAYPVHRLVAETFLGPLPDGWHTCHVDGDNQNNAVANLRYQTPTENNLDVVRHGRHVNANKTHCPQGHPYDEANTMRERGGGRKCLTCHRERSRRRRAAQRAARITRAA